MLWTPPALALVIGLLSGSVMAHDGAFLVVESDKPFTETVDGLRQAIEDRQLKLLREDSSDDAAAHSHTFYFCDFELLKPAVQIDPQIGRMLPCQITVTAQGERVILSARNPEYGREDGPAELDAVCAEAKDTLVEVMLEAAP